MDDRGQALWFVSVSVTPPKGAGCFDGPARVWGVDATGREHDILSYYPEEGAIDPEAIVGLTLREARALYPA